MTNVTEVITKIKSRGYWRVNFVPISFDPNRISKPGRCRDLVQESAIHLRGWDYPHVPRQDDDKQEIYVAGEKAESWIDWQMFKEAWRLYQTGQFLHFFGIHDDWYNERQWNDVDARFQSVEPNTQLDALEIIYRLTEVFVFLRNLCNSDVYKSEVRVAISLHGVKNRHLAIMDPRRIFFGMGYVCKEETISLPIKQLSASSEAGRFNEAALELAEYIFHQFQWDAVSKELFTTEQQRILTREWW